MEHKSMILKIINNKNVLSLLWQGFFAVFEAANIFILVRSYSKPLFGEIVFFFACVNILDFSMIGYIWNPLVRFLAAAKSEVEKRELVGSAWLMSFSMAILISFICCLFLFLFKSTLKSSIFLQFFLWYPLILLCSLPFNCAKAQLQAHNNFIKMIILQSGYNVTYLLFLILNFCYFKLPFQNIFIAYLFTYGLASVIALSVKWSGISRIKFVNKNKLKLLHNFGVYSWGSNIGSILLKNSPVLIIGMMLAKVQEAVYNVPYKLIGVFGIPLEGCAVVAFNKMSEASTYQENDKIINLYYKYVGVLVILFLPVILFFEIFSKQVIFLFAGKEYANSIACVNVFRISLIYVLFLTIDRFGGTVLDSINRPKYNLKKVIAMLGFNIIGIILVIYAFKTIESVAVICLATVAFGICLGTGYIKRELKISIFRIVAVGWDTIITYWRNIYETFSIQYDKRD